MSFLIRKIKFLPLDDKFEKVFNEVVEKTYEIPSDTFYKLTLPHHCQRQPPKSFDSASIPYTTDVKSRYGHMYYQLINIIIQLKERYDVENHDGLRQCKILYKKDIYKY